MNWLVFSVLASVFVSAATIAEKQLFKNEHVLEFLVSFSLFNAVVLWLVLGMPVKFNVPPAVWMWAVLGGLCGALMLYAGEKVIKHFDISVSSPALAVSALFTVILAAVFLGERFGAWQLLGLFWMLVGVLGLEWLHHKPKASKLVGKSLPAWIWLTVAVVFASVGGIIDKWVLDNWQITPNTYLLLLSCMQAIFVYVLAVFVRRRFLSPLFAVRRHPNLVLGIIAATLLQRYFYINAAAIGPISMVILIKRGSIFWTTLLGGKFFQERQVGRHAACAAALCIGLVFLLL